MSEWLEVHLEIGEDWLALATEALEFVGTDYCRRLPMTTLVGTASWADKSLVAIAAKTR